MSPSRSRIATLLSVAALSLAAVACDAKLGFNQTGSAVEKGDQTGPATRRQEPRAKAPHPAEAKSPADSHKVHASVEVQSTARGELAQNTSRRRPTTKAGRLRMANRKRRGN